MTYPQQPQPGYPAPPYPQQPQQGYAPQQPQQPYAPQGYPAPGQGYPPPPPNPYASTLTYPPQPAQPGYSQPYAAPQEFVPEAPPPTVSDFFEQPASAGGKALSFNVVGTRYVGTVVRDVTDADMERAREMGARPGMMGAVAKHPDGRDKINMKVPILLDQPTAEFPTGVAVWYVKGNERSELLRAMQMAGAEPGAPKGGDRIDITYTHDEPSRSGFNPRKVKRIVYTVGNGVLPQMPGPAQAQQPQPGYGVPGPAVPPALPPAVPNPYAAYQQPAYTQPPQMQVTQQPDPALAYQQATGQQMPPQGYQQYAPPPQVQMAPPAPAQTQFQPPVYAGSVPPEYSQGYQQAPPTGPGAPQGAPNGYTNGAPPTAAASPSSNPGGPPPDWPADVPFIPGLKPEQARIAALHHLGQQPPPQ